MALVSPQIKQIQTFAVFRTASETSGSEMRAVAGMFFSLGSFP